MFDGVLIGYTTAKPIAMHVVSASDEQKTDSLNFVGHLTSPYPCSAETTVLLTSQCMPRYCLCLHLHVY